MMSLMVIFIRFHYYIENILTIRMVLATVLSLMIFLRHLFFFARYLCTSMADRTFFFLFLFFSFQSKNMLECKKTTVLSSVLYLWWFRWPLKSLWWMVFTNDRITPPQDYLSRIEINLSISMKYRIAFIKKWPS